MKSLTLFLAAVFLTGCQDPLWHREGGLLNPWGGEFLGHHPKRPRP